MKFRKETTFPVPAATLWAFHERPDAFSLLSPPWQKTEILQPPTSLAVGTVVILRARIGPLWQRIVAKHVAYEPGRMFADEMVEGPFAKWRHVHTVTPQGENASTLVDEVDYELPLGALGRIFGAAIARRQLERLFAYRHEVTRVTCLAMPSGS
ncbi:MAG: cyclase/dehydrase [Labilithrix sp.]|nr:cyclase/dehydrase [Labilithrix sp.]